MTLSIMLQTCHSALKYSETSGIVLIVIFAECSYDQFCIPECHNADWQEMNNFSSFCPIPFQEMGGISNGNIG